jgi:hypothetical protein
VIHEPTALSAVLRRAGLDSPKVSEVVADDGTTILYAEIDRTKVFQSWEIARGCLEETKRWPVAITSWGESWAEVEDQLRQPRESHPQPQSEILEAAAAMSFDAALDDARVDTYQPRTDLELSRTERRCGSAPPIEQVERALGSEPDFFALEHWLFQWELEHCPAPRAMAFQSWLEPVENDHCCLLFLPQVESEAALAYVQFFAEEGYPVISAPALVAIFREWRERYGAELVAHWGTMLQLVADRPPSEPEEAWRLAEAHYAIAPSTFNGPSLREYAQGLIGGRTWWLHERP